MPVFNEAAYCHIQKEANAVSNVKHKLLNFIIFTCVLVVSLAVCGSFSVTAASDSSNSGYQAVKHLKSIVNLEDLEAVIADGTYACDKEIDISKFNISDTQQNQTCLNIFIHNEMPQNFHFKNIGVEIVQGKITKIKPAYNYTASQYHKMLSEVNKMKAEVLKDIKGNKNLNDVEKALLIHDRLALLCEYDFTYSKANANIYGALVKGVSVCEGYTQSYAYLLKDVGIESYYCRSDKLNHAWNIVCIDKKLYHVDVTRDDVAWAEGDSGAVGHVNHINFLRSSKGIYSENHAANDYETAPKDTKYDTYVWKRSHTAFQLIDNKLYYIDNTIEQLKCFDTKKTVCKVEDDWLISGSKKWENDACLSSGNGELYYSLSKAVYKYDFKTGLCSVVYKPSLKNYNSIYGMTYRDGEFVCAINDTSPSDKYSGDENVYLLKQAYKPQTVKTVKLSATSFAYDGKVKHPSVVVKTASGKTLKNGTDYKVTYSSGCKNVGTYKATFNMIGKYTGSKTLSFKINPVKVDKCNLKLSKTAYTYSGSVKAPKVTVKNANGKTLKKGIDYSVTYASGRKNVGTYKVTIKMKGNYTGSKTLTFKINPPKTAVSKLTAGKKSIAVNITKKSSQVSGYQIQYSTSKSFVNATTKTLSSYNTTKYTLNSLKAGKTYYVRVRTYKTVNGKKMYSDWSAYKFAKVK